MKRILYIGNKLAHKGATATTIDTLAKLLELEGFEVETASAKRNKSVRFLDMFWQVFSNRKNVDFVLIDTYSTLNFWYAYAVAKLCKKFGIKYIPIAHGGNLPHRLKHSVAASKTIFSHAHLVVVPSGYLFSEFKKAGFSNVKYIPNSIEISGYPFLLRKKFNPKLLWVRSFSQIYNPKLALLVLEGLLKKFPEAQLCMVGPEKDESFSDCKNYAEANNLPVTFTGKLEKEEWIQLSQDYDIFINTTNFDNMPVSVVEAMALGLPVISTNVGGIPFLLEDGKEALLVPANSAEAFIFEIEKIIQDPKSAEEITQKARAKAETFDWEIVKKDWKEILS